MPHKCTNPMSHLITSSSFSDPVPKPDIIIKKTQEMNNTCYLILSCMARNQSVNYTWYGDSGPISERLQSGVLNITIIPQNSFKFYRYKVSNPVSYNSDTVYFISPCKLGKKYSQGSWGGFRFTSFLLNEERCGDPFKFSWHRICWRIPKASGDSGSTHALLTPPSELTSLLWRSVSYLQRAVAQHVTSLPALIMHGPRIWGQGNCKTIWDIRVTRENMASGRVGHTLLNRRIKRFLVDSLNQQQKKGKEMSMRENK